MEVVYGHKRLSILSSTLPVLVRYASPDSATRTTTLSMGSPGVTRTVPPDTEKRVTHLRETGTKIYTVKWYENIFQPICRLTCWVFYITGNTEFCLRSKSTHLTERGIQ